MAKKKTAPAKPKPKATPIPDSPDVLDAMVAEPEPIEPVLEMRPEPVKRYEAPAPAAASSGKVRVRNVSRATYDGIAPGAVAELDPKHPGLHPLARELELVKG